MSRKCRKGGLPKRNTKADDADASSSQLDSRLNTNRKGSGVTGDVKQVSVRRTRKPPEKLSSSRVTSRDGNDSRKPKDSTDDREGDKKSRKRKAKTAEAEESSVHGGSKKEDNLLEKSQQKGSPDVEDFRGKKEKQRRKVKVQRGRGSDEGGSSNKAEDSALADNCLNVSGASIGQHDGKMSTVVKIISWNVAGIRAWIKKGAHQILYDLSPDVFGLQETKCNCVPEGLDLKGYHYYLESPVENNGRAGVMLLTKQKPYELTYGSKFSGEATGRLIIAEFERFYLINSYVPNSGRGLVNLEKRKEWENWFLKEIKKLDAKKPVVYTGDLNVAHQEIDLANPKSNKNKTAGFTDQERNDFGRLLDAGFVDVYRKLNPEKTGAYTFWSNMHQAREKNVGWRLDYFVISERIFNNVKKCEILSEYKGSDHCPIVLEISI